jgi:hypothetical protein
MFIVRTVFVKPADVKWYRAAEGTAQTLAQFGAAQFAAGAYLRNRTRKIGKNRVITTMVFADQAAYDTWRAACDVHPESIAKNAYFEANGITKVVKKFQMVE